MDPANLHSKRGVEKEKQGVEKDTTKIMHHYEGQEVEAARKRHGTEVSSANEQAQEVAIAEATGSAMGGVMKGMPWVPLDIAINWLQRTKIISNESVKAHTHTKNRRPQKRKKPAYSRFCFSRQFLLQTLIVLILIATPVVLSCPAGQGSLGSGCVDCDAGKYSGEGSSSCSR